MKWYRIKLDHEEDDVEEVEGYFPRIIERDYYVVTSPDIQGLVTEGNSLVEAVLNAYEAASLLLNDDDYNFRLEIMK